MPENSSSTSSPDRPSLTSDDNSNQSPSTEQAPTTHDSRPSENASSTSSLDRPSLTRDDNLNQSASAEQAPTTDTSLWEGTSRPKYRVSLYHLCTCIPVLAFAISKYSLNLRGESFKLGKYDMGLGVFQFILYFIGRWESGAPVKLRWFLDTDWGVIPNSIRKAASGINSRYKKIEDPFGFWMLLLTIIGPVHFVISTAWSFSSYHDHRTLMLTCSSSIVINWITRPPLLFCGRKNERLRNHNAMTDLHVVIVVLTAVLMAIVLLSWWIVTLTPIKEFGYVMIVACMVAILLHLLSSRRLNRIKCFCSYQMRNIARWLNGIGVLVSFSAIATILIYVPEQLLLIPVVVLITFASFVVLRLFYILLQFRCSSRPNSHILCSEIDPMDHMLAYKS